MLDCAHCGHAPEDRADPASSATVLHCPVCNNRGDVSTSRTYVEASWQRVNDPDMPPCLGCSGRPRFGRRGGLWLAVCAGCGFSPVGGTLSLEGAVAGWYRANRRGDGHYLTMWRQRKAECDEARRRA